MLGIPDAAFSAPPLLSSGRCGAWPAEIPAGEPDYALTVFYAGGSVEQVSLWMSGDHIFWQFKGEETAFYSAASPAQFESHITK